MAGLAGSIFAVVVLAMAVSAAPSDVSEAHTIDFGDAVVANQEAIAKLSEFLSTVMEADKEVKKQLVDAASTMVETQNALQKLMKTRRSGGGGGGGEGQQSSDSTAADTMKQITNQIVAALEGGNIKDAGTKNKSSSSGGSTVILNDILTELKKLNYHFNSHFTGLACPPPFVLLGSECFSVILEDKSWEDAHATCVEMGADLAQPQNITELKVYVGSRYPRKGRRNFWLGGVYREKVWQWLSGEPLPEGYWYINEPSGNGECLALFDGWDNPFTDFPCENERRAICQRNI